MNLFDKFSPVWAMPPPPISQSLQIDKKENISRNRQSISCGLLQIFGPSAASNKAMAVCSSMNTKKKATCNLMPMLCRYKSWYVSKVEKYNKKSFHHLTTFFMSTWWGDCKNMQEIEISRWFFELPANNANLKAIVCSVLFCPQKAIMGIKSLAYFCSPLVN